MISEKDLEELQNTPIDERVKRVEKLLEEKEAPRGFELGLLLALKMAQEIRNKKPLGSESGNLVASWNGKYPDSVIEEAIASAKEFMTHPGKLAEKIKAGMMKQNKADEENKDDTQAKNDEASDAE
ncbi:hypothetical protein [Fibrobacter sp.]|uniref:hypothetical protein n=1 Tax=Fibrobacter sp. TaxID=35828 RepID=UPI00388CF649